MCTFRFCFAWLLICICLMLIKGLHESIHDVPSAVGFGDAVAASPALSPRQFDIECSVHASYEEKRARDLAGEGKFEEAVRSQRRAIALAELPPTAYDPFFWNPAIIAEWKEALTAYEDGRVYSGSIIK